MLFDKTENKANDRVLYKTKPNLILGCKKAIYGFILLIVVLFISPAIIQFIGEMQVYLISYVKLSLTRYAAIAFFVVILFIVLYIIWQLMGWYASEYILTESKIIIKSGVLSTKKNYMPYATIQDINTSQSILAKLFNVGSVSVFSAYDNNQMELKNISNPSKAEEIIFSNMVGYRNFQQNSQQRFVRQNKQNVIDNINYAERNEVYDDFEPITPLGREKDLQPQRMEYEYYPEEIEIEKTQPKTYEYEPYPADYNVSGGSLYDESPNNLQHGSYYNQNRGDYSYGGDDYYQNNDSERYYNEVEDNISQNESNHIGEDTSENAIRRHFDKFKK